MKHSLICRDTRMHQPKFVFTGNIFWNICLNRLSVYTALVFSDRFCKYAACKMILKAKVSIYFSTGIKASIQISSLCCQIMVGQHRKTRCLCRQIDFPTVHLQNLTSPKVSFLAMPLWINVFLVGNNSGAKGGLVRCANMHFLLGAKKRKEV